jgi:hypothetical protein
VISFILLVRVIGAQSKKEQIELLTNRVDSLNGEVNQLRFNLGQLENRNNKLMEEKILLENDKSFTERENNKLKKNILARDSSINSLKITNNERVKELSELRDSLNRIFNSNNKVLTLLKSSLYAGTYSFKYKNGSSGWLQLYFDGNEDYYFHLEYIIGPPSYNMGFLDGIVKIYGNTAVFNANLNDYDGEECKIALTFDENGVFLKQYSFDFVCGFGAIGTISDYFYKDNSENNKIIPSENSSGTYIKSTNKW